jgi:hypothetical protein
MRELERTPYLHQTYSKEDTHNLTNPKLRKHKKSKAKATTAHNHPLDMLCTNYGAREKNIGPTFTMGSNVGLGGVRNSNAVHSSYGSLLLMCAPRKMALRLWPSGCQWPIHLSIRSCMLASPFMMQCRVRLGGIHSLRYPWRHDC